MDNTFVLNKLRKLIINYACPVCGGRQFSLHNDPATILTTENLSAIEIGTYIPTAVVICEKCGYISFFALGKLGIPLQNKGEDSNGKKE